MATNRSLRPNEIEDNNNEAIENEDYAETEDYLEVSEHELKSEQEGYNNDVIIHSEHETTSQPKQGILNHYPIFVERIKIVFHCQYYKMDIT
ncbi:hypothetical protein HHI36_004620 [Cryptolaemus montrouzieri]|uniref:Uncharacterized protein n=1 Tax=Cryptolaemus montrouzieri TaxID=559131 RepID=A0ABD2NSR4_9CUCU